MISLRPLARRTPQQVATLERLTVQIAPAPIVSLLTAEGLVLGRVYSDVAALIAGNPESGFRIDVDGELSWIGLPYNAPFPVKIGGLA